MTPDDIKAALALAEEAEGRAAKSTPGPWRWGDWSAQFGTKEREPAMVVLEHAPMYGIEPAVRRREHDTTQVLHADAGYDDVPSNADRTFIAAARTDVPRLAEAVRTLVGEVERSRHVVMSALAAVDDLGAQVNSAAAAERAALAAHAKLVAAVRDYADWLSTGPNTERVRRSIAERLLAIVNRATDGLVDPVRAERDALLALLADARVYVQGEVCDDVTVPGALTSERLLDRIDATLTRKDPT